MKASEITKAAMDLVGGDRARTHGDKTENHEVIARFWNAWLNSRPSGPLDAHDVANMMELLKVARRLRGSFNIDDYVDGAGYAAVAGEIGAERLRRDQSWADAAAAAEAAIEGCPVSIFPPRTPEEASSDIKAEIVGLLKAAGIDIEDLAEAS